MMNNPFEIDEYPGNPKILFIGLGVSTHTHSWIDLLSDSKLNVRLFSVPDGGVPLPDWKVPTYVWDPSYQLRKGFDSTNSPFVFALPRVPIAVENVLRKRMSYWFFVLIKKVLNLAGSLFGMPVLYFDYARYRDLHNPESKDIKIVTPDEWLAEIIRSWAPDIIHTLGLEPASYYYYSIRKKYELETIGKWVVQIRGGPDLALHRLMPDYAEKIRAVFMECDQVIADNQRNYDYALGMGLDKKQICNLGVLPGTGGIDIDSLKIMWQGYPSKREKIIVWPKAYDCPQSKALPVFEALKLAWSKLPPCKILMLAADPETMQWFQALPDYIKASSVISSRLPREEVLNYLVKARVMLAPSILDGIPNSLYEAMAAGAFPIVSPLETITPVVEQNENVLFARNLYPEEISHALIRAMNDDELVDHAAKNNLGLVKKIASRRTISRQVIEYYENITGRYPKEYSIKHENYPLVTVITPTYNRAEYLPETIESVLSQDYPNIEYLVLDDGSEDNTLEILKKYGDKIIIESHENMGETETVNKGFRMAKGVFICVVNSDDPLLPGAITKIVATLLTEPDALAAYPDWVEIDPQSKPIKEMNLPEYNIHNMLTDLNVAMGPGNIFRRRVLEKFGFRETTRKYTGDLEFWFRLASHGKLVHVSETLATHRTHPQSASVTEKSSKIAEEVLSIVISLFASGALPNDTQAKRRQILSFAYDRSTLYCSKEPGKKLKYLLLSFLYDPKQFLVKRIKSIFHKLINLFNRILGFIVFCMATIFQVSVPKKISNAFRARWRVMRNSSPEVAMKVAFVSHVLPPSWSGQSVMIGRILKNISPAEYCLISTENYQNEKDRNTGSLPGKYYVLPKEPEFLKLGGKYWLMNWLRAFYRGASVARIIGEEKCNIITAASGNLIDIPGGWWASVLSGVPFVPYLFDDYLYQWADEQTRSITRKMEEHIYGRVKIVIVPNEFMQDEIQKRHNVKAVIVRNPCASTPKNELQTMMTDYNPQEEIRIVFTGAIYHVNFDAFKNLIEATRQITLNIKIHLYTAQPLEWLEQNGVNGEQIVHHHHSVHAEAIEAQNHAHILFLPFSFHSPIPEVIRTSAPGKTGEYLNSGVPILVHVPTDTFISWYFRKYNCGYVVDTEEIVTLKRGIENLINDPVLRQKLVSNAKERAHVDFDPIASSKAFMQAMEGAF